MAKSHELLLSFKTAADVSGLFCQCKNKGTSDSFPLASHVQHK